MKKIVFFWFLIIAIAPLRGQERKFLAPNYEAIKKEIQQKKSDLFYPKLMERFATADTLLKANEMEHLYYGYIFQKEYNPYYNAPETKKLKEYYAKEKLEEADYKAIIELCNQSLSKWPLDLNMLNTLAFSYHQIGDKDMEKKASFKFQNVISAIFNSGNGKTCETAYHVISVSHEYVLINFFQLKTEKQALIGSCDYLSFEKGKYKVDGLYFNVGQLLKKESELLGKK